MTTSQLNTLLKPQSIAVVGASVKVGSLGYDTVEMVLRGGFTDCAPR